MNQQRAVIVGGGLGGLASAAYLARAGWRVTLYERARELGGRARTRHEGEFAFNQGPHAFYATSLGMEVLRELGITPRGARPKDAGSRAYVDGRLAALPTGFGSLLTTDLFGVGAKLRTARLLASLPKLHTAKLGDLTLKAWLDGDNARSKVRPEVRALVEAIVRVSTYANAPAFISARAALRQVQRALGGVLYLDGGWGTLAHSLAEAARSAGAELVTGRGAARIDGDVVTLDDGETVATDQIVIAASPSVARSLLETEELAHHAAACTPIHTACLDIALHQVPRPQNRFALGIDVPLYFSLHSATARLAPEGAGLIHVLKYLDPQAPADPARDRAELEALLDLMQPGWRAQLAHSRFLPSMTVSHRIDRPGLSVPSTLSAHPCVHLVGDWVGDDGMLADRTLASARAMAMSIAAREGERAVA